MQRVHAIVDSPIGPLTVCAREDGVITAILMDTARHERDAEDLGVRDDRALAEAAVQLGEYFAGERRAFELELAPEGSPFRRRVWALLRDIPYGRTRSYGELAAELGDPKLTRAVGTANGANPISIVVPCHRVIGADGSLTGYAGGMERKRFLLELERERQADDRLF